MAATATIQKVTFRVTYRYVQLQKLTLPRYSICVMPGRLASCSKGPQPDHNRILFRGETATSEPLPTHCQGFTITLRHNKLSRTPLDEWSALYLKKHDNHKRQTSTTPEEFETTVSGFKQPQIHALDRAATGIGIAAKISLLIFGTKNDKTNFSAREKSPEDVPISNHILFLYVQCIIRWIIFKMTSGHLQRSALKIQQLRHRL